MPVELTGDICSHVKPLSLLWLLHPVHAAVIAINDAIDHGVPEGTMAAMRNPNAMLVNLDEGSAQHYQDTLSQAKALKVENARKRVGVGRNTRWVQHTSFKVLSQLAVLSYNMMAQKIDIPILRLFFYLY